jgi:hypothetical protein
MFVLALLVQTFTLGIDCNLVKMNPYRQNLGKTPLEVRI